MTFDNSTVRHGITYEKWPFRLDIQTQYQDWILVGVSLFVVLLCCLPCFCGGLRSRWSKTISDALYSRMNVFYTVVAHIGVALVLFTVGVCPDWTVNEYLVHVILLACWIVAHTEKVVFSAAIMFGIFIFMKWRKRIAVAAGVDHLQLVKFDWRDLFGMHTSGRPIEIFFWKVEDLESAKVKVLKANDVFIECHLGLNEPMCSRVHHNAGSQCDIKESFQLNFTEQKNVTMTILVKDQSTFTSQELARVVLDLKQISGIEDQTGKRFTEFEYCDDAFVSLEMLPRGKVWIAIQPVDTSGEEVISGDGEEDHLIGSIC